MHILKRFIASVLIVATATLGVPLVAQASIVSTSDAVADATTLAHRATVDAFLARADVQQGLQAQGLSAADASARVQAMSHDEVAALAGRVDAAPAGGDVLGLMFTVFIVLLVTDIVGLTKVFPFTRSVR
jgi:hypothetical protein